jgi:hypothetical protein
VAEKTSRVHDPVNHPQHYTAHPSGIEVIELTRCLPFGPGNAVKYALRHGLKGSAAQDLDKAIWYLTDSIDNNVAYVLTNALSNTARRFIEAEPNPYIAAVLTEMMWYDQIAGRVKGAHDFTKARSLLTALREHGL